MALPPATVAPAAAPAANLLAVFANTAFPAAPPAVYMSHSTVHFTVPMAHHFAASFAISPALPPLRYVSVPRSTASPSHRTYAVAATQPPGHQKAVPPT